MAIKLLVWLPSLHEQGNLLLLLEAFSGRQLNFIKSFILALLSLLRSEACFLLLVAGRYGKTAKALAQVVCVCVCVSVCASERQSSLAEMAIHLLYYPSRTIIYITLTRHDCSRECYATQSRTIKAEHKLRVLKLQLKDIFIKHKLMNDGEQVVMIFYGSTTAMKFWKRQKWIA